MRLAQQVSLTAATITSGLMAGLFAAFAFAVMPRSERWTTGPS